MSYKIISKFIKDISFEIPNPQTFVMLEKEILNYTLNFDIKSKPFKENIVEVNTILKILPNQDVKHKMLTEINYTSLVSLDTPFVQSDSMLPYENNLSNNAGYRVKSINVDSFSNNSNTDNN